MSADFKRKVRASLFILLGFLVGAIVVVLYFHNQNVVKSDCIKKYALTSATLDCASYEDAAATLHSLDQKLDQATALYIKEDRATRMSVWVRDLNANQWASTNEFELYTPASLLKLPLMIAYYKVAEIQPAILNGSLTYTRSDILNDSSQDFAPTHTLVEGQSYTVNQLIAQMITESDNNATALLLGHIDQDIFNNTLFELGIKIPSHMNSYDFVTAKSYANIFRILYNASYLTRDSSEKALELLASSSFKGIADPLPASTVVAHKFGEREVDNPDGTAQTRELHDCGIVYKDSRPYSVCILTEGKDFNSLLSIIKETSLLIYQNI